MTLVQQPGTPAPHKLAALPSAYLLTALMALAEAMLLTGALLTPWGTAFWVVAHLAVVGFAAAVVARRASPADDLAPHILALFACLVAGVFGALLAAVAIAVARASRPDPRLLDAWYERIANAGDVDPVTRLATAIAVGRGVRTDTSLPQDFEGVIDCGSTAERQNALGLIARQFVPAYAGALRSALVSPEPVIRVQAAAVAVKVKAELASILELLADTSAPCDARQAAEAAASLVEMRATGLLDGEDESRAETAAAVFTRLALSGFSPGALAGASPGALAIVETELLRERRFAEFRAVRALASASGVSVPSVTA